MRKFAIGAAMACALSTPALAAPGMADEVYGATVEKGELEIESRYGRLNDGPDDGEDVIKLEAAYGVTDRLRLGILAEFEKEPGEVRRGEELAIEAIYHLGKAGPIDFAVYGEYAIGLNGHPDVIEGKLLLQHKSGPWDLRLNLIAEKELVGGEPVEFGYAASADVEAVGELRVGVEAFGELGSTHKFLPYAEHFMGPVIKAEVEGLGPEIGIEVGYLFAIGKAREDAKGQLRVAFALEF